MKQIPLRITIKIGSNVLTRSNGTLDVTRMSALVDQIAQLHQKGIEVILISSGAVASGRSEIGETTKLDNVDQRQLFSAVGQVKLINRYYELFREYGIPIGQVLTTKENFSTRRHYLTQKNCMAIMLANGIIPIVNENDTISVSELMFTDNDELSGLIASMMNAEQLIILSNIDGIYNGNPTDTTNQVVRTIQQGEDISSYIQTSKSAFGRGGMLTKTRIASKVADEGIAVVIANGKRDQILTNLIDYPEETICTRFVPNSHPISNVKKWIAHSEGFAKGEVHLNEKATRIITQTEQASSILLVGITRIEGDFEKDDIVRIIDFEGNPIGIGKSDYSAEQALKKKGKHGEKPIVHYDYLYLE